MAEPTCRCNLAEHDHPYHEYCGQPATIRITWKAEPGQLVEPGDEYGCERCVALYRAAASEWIEKLETIQ